MVRLRHSGSVEHWTTPSGCVSSVYVVRNSASVGGTKTVFVMVPGNPGVVEYYAQFADAVFNAVRHQAPRLDFDVVSLSHPGHSFLDHQDTAFDGIQGTQSVLGSWNAFFGQHAARALSLRQQMDHKVELLDNIKTLYPKNTRYIIGGHSIGAYMSVELLKNRPENVIQTILLFPTIKDIAASKKGRVVSKVVLPGVRHLLSAILFFLRSLLVATPALLYFIVALFTGMSGDPLKITVERLLHHNSGLHALTLGNDEMKRVKELDAETIGRHLEDIVFYYGPDDAWADESYYRDLLRVFPKANAHLCDDDAPHDFVIHHSELMGRKVAGWICDKVAGMDAGKTSKSE
ncbi:hypothetical protein BC830DRAFT_1121878 [Chytriomyces sp. MP71]|nr:hypothetical protein BC830DRAFT_1121878 [Chytriomyces sp. MP71]